MVSNDLMEDHVYSVFMLTGTNQYTNQWWYSSLTHICVTWLWWIINHRDQIKYCRYWPKMVITTYRNLSLWFFLTQIDSFCVKMNWNTFINESRCAFYYHIYCSISAAMVVHLSLENSNAWFEFGDIKTNRFFFIKAVVSKSWNRFEEVLSNCI